MLASARAVPRSGLPAFPRAAPDRAAKRGRRGVACAAASAAVTSLKEELLAMVQRTDRGVTTTPADLQAIQAAVEELRRAGQGTTTSTKPSTSGTWELLWTTEKETLFILQRAPLFGTRAGPVFQVVDVDSGILQNVITFPPEGSFIVDSSLTPAGPQRLDFQFSAATLKLPAGRELRLPPFGKGWFDNVYLDETLRVSCDSRGDTLITRRTGPPRRFT